MTRTDYFASHSITGATLTISFDRIVPENMQIAYACFHVRGLLIRYFFNMLKILSVFLKGMKSVPLFHIPSDELWFTTYKGSQVMLFGIKMFINMIRCHFTSNTFLIFYLMIKEAQYLKPSEMYWTWPLSLSPQAHDIMKKLKLPKIDTHAYPDNQWINFECILMPLSVYYLKYSVHVLYLDLGILPHSG